MNLKDLKTTFPNDNIGGLILYYYSSVYKGEFEVLDLAVTRRTIWYLLENNIKYESIINELQAHENDVRIDIPDLTSWLYQGSLLKKDAFYFHRELILTSDRPVFDYLKNKEIVPEFYYLPKIKYSEKDVVNYFYKKLSPLNLVMADYNRDLKTVKYLLAKFNVDYVEPIDILLCSIDRLVQEYPDTYKLIDATNVSLDVARQLKSEAMELRSQNKHKNTLPKISIDQIKKYV